MAFCRCRCLSARVCVCVCMDVAAAVRCDATSDVMKEVSSHYMWHTVTRTHTRAAYDNELRLDHFKCWVLNSNNDNSMGIMVNGFTHFSVLSVAICRFVRYYVVSYVVCQLFLKIVKRHRRAVCSPGEIRLRRHTAIIFQFTCVCMSRMKTSVCFARAVHCLLAASIIGT